MLSSRCRRLRRLACVSSLVLAAACGGSLPAAPVAPSAIPSTQGTQVQPASRDMKPVVEALFLGTGPLARTDSPGCDSSLQRMRGWPRGSRISVVAYAGVDAERRDAIRRTLAQANQVLGAIVGTDYRTRDDLQEPEGSLESTIAVFAVAASRAPALCGSASANCQVVRYNSGEYISSRVILSQPFDIVSNGIVAHEIGHAFGLCHLDPTRGGLESTASIMGNSLAERWTSLDVEAIRLVYGAGLSPGDSRGRFVAAGLVE